MNSQNLNILNNKNIMRSDIELMAPAGNFESLYAAFQGGANSVYFGVGRLNMRAKSSVNFTVNDLPEIARLCKRHQVKSYLTVNTVIYDNDMEEMMQILDSAAGAGINAIIATDIAVMMYASSKKIAIHASTQLNISNIESLRFYAQWIDVAVLSRELNLNQVQHITQLIKKENIRGVSGNLIKIEMFAHGALCMAISGKCYLSLHETGASANRGACQQTCRKSYIVTEKETGNQLEIDHEYIMSPKDLCTIGFLNKMLDAGVAVFKIEGRARGPEYVKTVCETYNKAFDAIFNNTYSFEKFGEWKKQLARVFNRGFWDGYYLGQKLGEWSSVYGSTATQRKEYIAKVTNYFSNIGVAELKVEAGELSVGQEAMFIGATTGVVQFTVAEIRKDNQPVKIGKKGDTISIPLKFNTKRNDRLYIFVQNETLNIH